MTALIVSDESGDLGSRGSKYFIISTIIAPSFTTLKPVLKYVKNKNFELKYYNSTNDEKYRILRALSILPMRIVYVVTEKNNPTDHRFVYGRILYERTLCDVIDLSLNVVQKSDVNIVIDENMCITQRELRNKAEHFCKIHSKNLKICRKGISQNEPCLRVADIVAGAIRTKYEQEDDFFYNVIKSKIAIVRKYRKITNMVKKGLSINKQKLRRCPQVTTGHPNRQPTHGSYPTITQLLTPIYSYGSGRFSRQKIGSINLHVELNRYSELNNHEQIL